MTSRPAHRIRPFSDKAHKTPAVGAFSRGGFYVAGQPIAPYPCESCSRAARSASSARSPGVGRSATRRTDGSRIARASIGQRCFSYRPVDILMALNQRRNQRQNRFGRLMRKALNRTHIRHAFRQPAKLIKNPPSLQALYVPDEAVPSAVQSVWKNSPRGASMRS